MKRLDISVNSLSDEALKEHLFQGTWDSVDILGIGSKEFDKYSNLCNLLEKYSIQNRKICIINPPQVLPEEVNRNTVINKRYMDYTPNGLLYLAAAVRKFAPSWTVQIIDLNLQALKRAYHKQGKDFESLLKLIPDDFDLYGVSMMFESWELQAVRCLEYVRKKKKLVIAGGVHGSVTFKNLLNSNLCDIVIKKEGETQLVKLLNLWDKVNSGDFNINRDLCEFYNLAFRHNGKNSSFKDKFENPVTLDIREEYKLIDLDEYNKFGAPNIWCRIAATGRKWATMLANRGCRGKCTFCQVSYIMGQGVRGRSKDDLLDEIKSLYHEKGVRHIEFVDDDFIAHRKNTIEWLNALAELKLDLSFSVGSGVLAIQIDEEIAQAMADAGCIMTGFGVESGNEERLKSLRKLTSLKKVKIACEVFKKTQRHIWLQANFILGFPDETYGELMDTFNFGKSLEIDYCQSSILRPIIGTPIYDELAKLNDERIAALDAFGTEKRKADTAGRDIVLRGLSFDDVFNEVIDFRKVDFKEKPGPNELQQFQIFFNTHLNLVGSVNLKPGGMPEKIKKFTDDVLKAYPMDAVSWGVNAQAARLLGDEQQYEISAENYRKAMKNSSFWSMFFELYDIPELIGIPV